MRPGDASHAQRFWDIRAASNFIGGGTGAGLLLAAALGSTAGAPYFLPGLLGLVFVGFGLSMVWLEIGKPWRAVNVFFRPQTSWMSREAIVAVAVFGSGVVALASALAAARLYWPVGPALLTAAFGLVFLYCQLRMLYAVRGIPAWRERRLMPLVGLSGLVEGLGVYLLLAVALGFTSTTLLGMALILLVSRAWAWHGYMVALDRGDAPAQTLSAFRQIRTAFLVVGHGAPALLLVLAYLWPALAGPLEALAGAGLIAGGWLFKIVLITRAAHTRGVSLPVAPARGGAATPISPL